MASRRLAVIINNPSNNDEFLLIKQAPPLPFNDEEYDSYVDSDLWDLPSTQLNSLEGESQSPIIVEGEELCSEKINLREFDLNLSLNQIFEQIGFGTHVGLQWKFWKCIEEPEFGPGFPALTVYIAGKFGAKDGNLTEFCKWMCIKNCLNWLTDVKPKSARMGPLVVVGLLNGSMQSEKWKIPATSHFQEYPPGVKIVPMRSRTAKPFRTTNLFVFSPENNVAEDFGDDSCIVHGDALIVDPGCLSEFHKQLTEIIAALPRKLVVFVTHHHHDHIDGLSVVLKNNPDASLLAHENTIRRIGKDNWPLDYISVSGGEEICIGGQRLKVIHAPEYFQTTYKFLELSPHALMPMHGRVNLWPKHMLCGYLKNRRSRESSILKAIEEGAKTLFDIVAYTYADVDRSLWIHAASNVRLHVDHLAQQDKLPKDFSLENFMQSVDAFAGEVVKSMM